MKKYKYLDLFPKPFLSDLVANRCLPFIGAGFSKNAIVPKGMKMLDWNELGIEFANQITGYKYTTAIDAISAFSHEYSRTVLVEKLSEFLLIGFIKAGKTHKAFCNLQFDIVCTTNFDFLLEDGYSLIPRGCHPLIGEEQLSIGTSSEAVKLLKIHGDLHHPKKLVATEEDYDHFLGENPMLATFLANLLITRTPLFIGYSLEDTDFRQVWQLIKDRLGKLRRQAYTVRVACSQHEIAQFERRGVKVINLPGNPSNYPQILEDVFIELKDYWNEKLLKTETISEEATMSELALPEDSQNRLCFFSIPARLIPFYKKYIFPIARSYDLVPISADDVISTADNWVAKVSALINKADIIVGDISTSNSRYEIQLALNEKVKKDNILIITEENSLSLPEISNFRSITRPDNLFENIDHFTNLIDEWFSSIIERIRGQYDAEPRRLLAKREYKAAVIASITQLEVHVRQKLIANETLSSVTFNSNSTLFQIARNSGLITDKQLRTIRKWIEIRNRAVHLNNAVSSNQAKEIVEGAYKLIKDMEHL